MMGEGGVDVLEETLRRVFGLGGFREGQREVIERVMAGRAVTALFPTGAGKSLCYQLPAVLLEGDEGRAGLTVVVSPLVALMKDQVERLGRLGIAARRWDSSLSDVETEEVEGLVRRGGVRLLFVSPERFVGEAFAGLVAGLDLVLLAVDEAHCVSEWGHGFRPDYLRVAQVAGELKVRCVLALTATATREVAADIAGRFGMGADAVVRTGFERGNLRYVVSFCEADERLEVLLSRLRQQEGAVIVYVQRQETAEAVGTFLRRAGLGVRVYHAGLPLEVRTEAQEGYMRGDFPVMVATVAFGMGVDKADVRAVFHYNLPRSIESYLQESGRAGRDGEAALCEVLACVEDEVLLGNLVRGGMIPAGVLRQAVHHLLRRGRRFDVSKYDLGVALDLWPVEIETILACLEQEGFLRCVGERYDAYQWRALVGEEGMLAGWEAGRQDFLRRLLKLGERSWRGVRLDVNEAAEKLGVDEDEVVQALQDLAEGGEIRLKGMGARVCYELCAAGDDVRPSEVAERVVERFGRRQEGEIRRLEAVMGYVGQAGCLQQWLLGYLGESCGRECGRCGVCTGEGRGGVEWVSGTAPELTLEAVACMRELQKEGHPALKSPWQQARFLCGLRSFAAQRAKLGGHPLFGRLKGYLFEEVLAHLVV